MILTVENVKAELSYAYLHAVASRAGFSCKPGDRHDDGAGIDAFVSAYGRLAEDSVLTQFTLNIQLKATSQKRRSPRGRDDVWSYSLELPHYDKLRVSTAETASQQLLVVLYMPEQDARWLSHSADQLVTRRCAYWMSLQGAPASTNATRQTVYLPRANVMSADELSAIMTELSRGERYPYGG